MKRLIYSCLAIPCMMLLPAAFSEEAVPRPKISGIAYYATFVSNLEKAR